MSSTNVDSRGERVSPAASAQQPSDQEPIKAEKSPEPPPQVPPGSHEPSYTPPLPPPVPPSAYEQSYTPPLPKIHPPVSQASESWHHPQTRSSTPQEQSGGLNLTVLSTTAHTSGPPSGACTPVSEVGVATNVIIRDDVNLSSRTPMKQEEEEELKHAYSSVHAYAMHTVAKPEVKGELGSQSPATAPAAHIPATVHDIEQGNYSLVVYSDPNHPVEHVHAVDPHAHAHAHLGGEGPTYATLESSPAITTLASIPYTDSYYYHYKTDMYV
ncbi:hypothetical protein SK128_027048 [Halocaridina rubra]|uniref:Uncharacterized protein n=1 Tax=Halocaridina rubra TaxID=373956 RepID=A0AAN8XM43_HALRR